MKISLDWLSQYIEIPLSVEELGDVLTEIGLEVEGIHEHQSVPGGLVGVVIGHVVECGKHPNADRLSLTKVDVGAKDLLQIVCGAPNVATGQKVPVATVGTTLYDQDGKPFKIKKGKIRGEASEGMICAEDELSLGTGHDGIMVLAEDAEVGMEASTYFDVKSDVVFEIALTPNRSDATSHLGVARDLAAALKINHDHPGTVRLPDLSKWTESSEAPLIDVQVEDPTGCPRYAGVTLDNLTVSESPEWLKKRLTAIGVRPINNIVDVTNFVLHEYGQPLHAFDLGMVTDHKIRVMTLPENTPFLTLDEQERKLSAEDLMICDGEGNGMCIAGVFGGLKSGVTTATTSIFLESAHFNAKRVRRSSTRHLLHTDAARVFEKGSDPNVCVSALKRAALMIEDLCEGRISSQVVDVYPSPIESRPIRVRYSHLNKLIGAVLPAEEVKNILTALKAEILSSDEEGLTVQFPTDKADVTREADVIEEVLRIYGFNKVPLPSKVTIGATAPSSMNSSKLREQVANRLVALGFLETMSLSLVRDEALSQSTQVEEETLIRINNTSNVQLEVLRPNLLVSMLENISYNQNRQQQVLQLFEFGKSYGVEEGEYVEREHLSLALTEDQQGSWLRQDGGERSGYYRLKGVVDHILAQLGLSRAKSESIEDPHLEYGIAKRLGKTELVRFGAVSTDILQRMDIRSPVYVADFDWQAVVMMQRVDKLAVQPVSRFPSVRRDLALSLKQPTTYAEVTRIVTQSGGKNITEIDLFDVYQDKKMKAKGEKSYAISLVFSDAQRTLSDSEIEKHMAKIVSQLQEKLDAQLR
ncbi:MAG: phenylalanine--tRNA ligase subunit beta [Saprospiraceae bacterium]|nr:phenylalanine--tRNA ligase subunit beta [Saprospiraceae bacterium]